MSGDLVLYTHPMSRGRTARWMLEETGVPYRTELLEYGTSMKAAAFLAINPMGKVPALTHDGVVVTETAAICAYLADAFPAAGLAPEGASRGPYFRWLFFAGPLEAAVTNAAMGFELPEGKGRMAGYGSLDAVLDVIEQAVAGRPFLVGDRMSAADVVMGAQLGFGMMFGTIKPRPAFEAYCAGLMARPAACRARALDDALLAAGSAAGG